MPHSNGKIYSAIVNGVRKGISTDDVNAVLGAGTHNIKKLCTHKNIKAAAIFRPRFMGGAIHVDPENFHSYLSQLAPPSSGASGVTMECVKYGIWVPRFDSLVNGRPFNASHIRWNLRPCDSTQFGDITHFDGYDHNAKFTNPVQSVVCSNNATIKVTFKDSSTSESMTARTLFGDNEDAYFGFVVYEYTGEGPILSGTGAVTPRVFVHNYQLAQSTSPQVVASTAAREVGASSSSSDMKARTGYSYYIIPVVAVNTGNGVYDYYSLNIHDSVPGFIMKKVGSGDIEFIYFRYVEDYSFYPDGDYPGTGTATGLNKSAFTFALLMTSSFNWILDTSTGNSTPNGLIKDSTIKITAKFKRMSDGQLFTKDYTTDNGLVVQQQLATDVLRMYIPNGTNGSVVGVHSWAQSAAGTLAGYFDFDISFTINVNTSGSTEANKYSAQLWESESV